MDLNEFPQAPDLKPAQTLESKIEKFLRVKELLKSVEEARDQLREEVIADVKARGSDVYSYEARGLLVKVSHRTRKNIDWSTVRKLACIPEELIADNTKVTEYDQLDVEVLGGVRKG